MDKFSLKTPEEIEIMAVAGKKLSKVKKELKKAVKIGVSAMEIEELADKLILDSGAEASFKTVDDYKWATCINLNAGLVHGIPKKEMVFKEGDVVSVDVGLFYKGFHSDTSFSVLLGKDSEKQKMLEKGKEILNKAIKKASIGNKISDISSEMENGLKKAGYNPIRALVGHGIGKNLHEEPMIPCYVADSASQSPKIVEGMALAIEIMYTTGTEKLIVEEDGWTIRTRDGKISALFEETVAITKNGPKVLTA